ncbi:Uncharacterised protein [uncultured Clostridium sp.]|uniref:hypothetical protein n=1 Tax=uncultured Clostridium sp. TaxID=59620 RepID=UPI0008202ED2|nr:hypothetical protein [uncultured Clostridium sp.]SCJ52124.1 Uncharacterised protein [uncultured Clostridium sp.]
MSLDKAYLRNKVKQGIDLMPSDGLVIREILNDYGEKEGYGKVADLRGVLYNASNNKYPTIIIKDSGELTNKSTKCFLVDYNDFSILVNKGNFIFINGKCYKITDPGEEFEVYYEFKLEEYHLVLEDGTIRENDEIYIISNNHYWSYV